MHPQWIHELIEEIGEGGLSLSDTALHEHSSDQSHHPGIRPVVIVSPASTEDVVPTPGTCRRINEIWQAKHELSYAFSHIPGKKMLGSDVCVPLSQLA